MSNTKEINYDAFEMAKLANAILDMATDRPAIEVLVAVSAALTVITNRVLKDAAVAGMNTETAHKLVESVVIHGADVVAVGVRHEHLS